MEHRTSKGSWTRDQIVSLGVEWPPKTGWLDTIIGNEISESAANRFESAVFAKGNKTIRLSPEALKKADSDVLHNLISRISAELMRRRSS